jgi:NAD(P)-dependent dehydrogenase (short-subunit alcohol dehydrogenase family)
MEGQHMDSDSLNGKVAVVTGAGSGIGKAISLTLARNGCAVALAARTESRLRAAQAEIQAFGGTADVFLTDVGVVAQCESLIRDVAARFGRLDILVNNAVGMGEPKAGPSSSPPRLAQVTPEEWDQAYAVTVRGAFILSKQAIPYLSKQPRAFIVNIGTQATRRCQKGAGVYVATKNALRGMSVVLSKELRETTGIRVHMVHPGATNSQMAMAMMTGASRPDLLGAKWIDVQEIADVVLFLVTRTGNGMIDEIYVRREDADYWCFS